MPSRNDRKGPLLPRLSYTYRVHLKRRFAAVDFSFLAAVAALAAATVTVTRYL